MNVNFLNRALLCLTIALPAINNSSYGMNTSNDKLFDEALDINSANLTSKSVIIPSNSNKNANLTSKSVTIPSNSNKKWNNNINNETENKTNNEIEIIKNAINKKEQLAISNEQIIEKIKNDEELRKQVLSMLIKNKTKSNVLENTDKFQIESGPKRFNTELTIYYDDDLVINGKERPENVFEQVDEIEMLGKERPENVFEQIDEIEIQGKERPENVFQQVDEIEMLGDDLHNRENNVSDNKSKVNSNNVKGNTTTPNGKPGRIITKRTRTNNSRENEVLILNDIMSKSINTFANYNEILNKGFMSNQLKYEDIQKTLNDLYNSCSPENKEEQETLRKLCKVVTSYSAKYVYSDLKSLFLSIYKTVANTVFYKAEIDVKNYDKKLDTKITSAIKNKSVNPVPFNGYATEAISSKLQDIVNQLSSAEDKSYFSILLNNFDKIMQNYKELCTSTNGLYEYISNVMNNKEKFGKNLDSINQYIKNMNQYSTSIKSMNSDIKILLHIANKIANYKDIMK